MKETIENDLRALEQAGNFRRIPQGGADSSLVDLTSNDYLGLGARDDLRREFCRTRDIAALPFSASASRLLAGQQEAFTAFEDFLSRLYGGRRALVFNSGYHANTGLVSALSTKNTIILADRLVHASIIDGIRLGGAPFERFRHNDTYHLRRLAEKAAAKGLSPLIIAESVYSMDGDKADIEALAEVKRSFPGAMLYIDEAHAVGVEGPQGLGLCKASRAFADVDVIVGTLGKALASVGAYAILGDSLRDYAVNKARSFIFSTALPPVSIEWSHFIMEKSLAMDAERNHLKALAVALAQALEEQGVDALPSHIQPIIVGDPKRAVALSAALRSDGFNVLPIRTPTVPPGTDRLRLSLSASFAVDDMRRFGKAFAKALENTDMQ